MSKCALTSSMRTLTNENVNKRGYNQVLKMHGDIKMSVDNVLVLAEIIMTFYIKLPKNKETISKTMLMERHQWIAPLFSDDLGVPPLS